MDNPQRFGRFWLHEKIGFGGMAEIFRASIGPDPDTYAFDCVVKRMHPRLELEDRFVSMFNVEQYLASLLRHPNIVETYEAGTIEGQRYVAMELIRGTDLGRLQRALQERSMRLPPELAIYIALQVLRALDYLHRATTSTGAPLDLVHRDVSPSNIYLGFDGTVKLGDFGVARVQLLEEEQGESAKLLKGKPAYMPPEVVSGEAPQAQQDDLWSLGVCLYEMLTMQQIHGGISEAEIRDSRPSPRLPAPQTSRTPIDKGLQRVLGLLLNANPKKRPQTAAACYGLLRRYLSAECITVERDVLSRFVLATMGDPVDMARSVELSARDSVTGLYNGRHLLKHLQTEVDRALRYQRALSVLLLDVDDFAQLVTVFGRGKANEVLSIVAKLLKGEGSAPLRSSDYVARRGRDKFCVALPETGTQGALRVAQRMRDRVEQHDWSGLDTRFEGCVTVSIGVASFPQHGETARLLLEAAEVARFRGERGGKNRVVAADVEFSALRQKVGDGTATDTELERWTDLSQAYLRANTPQGHRRFQRAGIAVEVAFSCQEELVRAYSHDIGSGGVRLLVPGALQKDSLLDLTLHLPGYEEPVVVPARVAWTRSESEVVGLEFLELADDVRDRIDALVWDETELFEGV